MASVAKPHYTLEEYLAGERIADHKSEFLSGEIFAMAGTSYIHAVVVANLMRVLGNALRGGPCSPVVNDLRVQVQATGLNTYPDIVIVCGEPQFTDDHLDTLVNPTLLMEVLSPSTEAYDRGEKFAHYRRIESLTDYVMVAQDKQRIEHYTRQGEFWMLTEHNAPDAELVLPALDGVLPLSEVYAHVS